MKKAKFVLILLFVLFLVSGTAAFKVQADESLSRKIVVFRPGTSDIVKDGLIGKFQGAGIKRLRLVNGRAAILSRKASQDLAKQPEVLRVDDDAVVYTTDDKSVPAQIKEDAAALPQALPWGVERINADDSWAAGNTGAGIKVGIIDTGISNIHPDLASNVKGGVNTITVTAGWNDDNGHGSHVAGIVAALDNADGVVGVGPQIDLYAIKAMDANGSGYISDIIEGLDWAVANGIQVVNMSLGTTSNIQSFRDAIVRAKNAGIVVVASAGNSGGAVNYPGAYPEVIGVSAIDSNNTIASFSSRGSQVDLAAPGVSIYSTYKGVDYATLSGTSMAAPHVTGAAALVLAKNNGFTPDQVQAQLQSTAQDLGDAGFDNLYGWGLVDAFAAASVPGPAADTFQPVVSLTGPANNVVYSTAQTVTISANANDNVGVAKVEFYDGDTLLGTDTTSPYSYSWAITSANNGTHSLIAKAYDAAGNSKVSCGITVMINFDLTAPTVSITSPADNTVYTKTQIVTIAANATDDVKVSKVAFYDNASLLGTDTASPYSFSWSVTSSRNGRHSLTAVAYDAAGNAAVSNPANVYIDVTAPTVSLTNPSAGKIYTVKQTVNIAANATDDIGVVKVEFYDGTTLLGTDNAVPYEYSWEVNDTNNGVHSLTAKAYDAAGNSKVSTAVSVSVDTIAPSVSITSPANNSVYAKSQFVTVTASASDNIKISKVEFYDGTTLLVTDTSSPYSYSWTVTKAKNGSHPLTAKAYDSSGNTVASTPVTVSVAIP